MDKQSLKEVLRVISQTVDALSQEQIDALFAGKGQLVFASSETPQETPSSPPAAPAEAPSEPPPETTHAEEQPTQPPAKAKKRKTSAKPAPLDLGVLWARLTACSDRSEARELLSSMKNADLAALAKAQKINVKRGDRKERLIDELIHFSIGIRLRREAIDSLDLKETRRPESD